MYQDPNQSFIVQPPESGSKKFWRTVFGSMLGFIFSCILLIILSFFFMVSMVASFTPEVPTVQSNSILKLTLDNEIVEQAVPSPFEGVDGLEKYGVTTTIGLDEILKSIEFAATDPNITGIYLNVGGLYAGHATAKEIRDALLRFKESGKFIYSYSESYSQGSYFLTSVADVVAINPQGFFDFKGVSSSVLFYKGLLEKLDLDVQIVRHGEFKSAVEPYILDKMSEANRNQMTLLTNTFWDVMTESIAKSRNLSIETLDEIAENLSASSAQKAKELGLVDKMIYAEDVENDLKTLSGQTEKPRFVTLANYKKTVKDNLKMGADKIAVIYASGSIVDGKTTDGIGSTTITQHIKSAYKDSKVKAIVLRVNSPGGSGLASEVIWKEIENAKAAGKTVVTSMGDYAASGGYYIACNSDAIVAQPNTLTGSIGVFSMIPSVQNTLKNKLGITVDVVKTNPHADYFSGMRKMDQVELNVMQAQVEDFYSVFIQRVADGRNMTTKQVDEIGQGRVWAGKDALNLKLVDKLGTINDAIALAAEMVGVADYRIEYFPKKKDWLTMLLEKDDDSAAIQQAIRNELGDMYFTYKALKQITDAKGVQARMPMEIVFE
ncbi:signal peptide peptidase SppA [Bacteroidales bacterium OttesenSCG-928-C03]|nr:signal peptide peptidase SppA [Bacteroidales bacterium OttesenSCG-928-C03]MDL2325497.1 signal peptide peptidase SppA [Bacteroidales bacterium OttesenSCG-928-A14]